MKFIVKDGIVHLKGVHTPKVKGERVLPTRVTCDECRVAMSIATMAAWRHAEYLFVEEGVVQ